MKKDKPVSFENVKALVDLCEEAELYGKTYFWINDKAFCLQRLYIMPNPMDKQ
jgi:hypothetical protein